jgi:hypothetical protein
VSCYVVSCTHCVVSVKITHDKFQTRKDFFLDHIYKYFIFIRSCCIGCVRIYRCDVMRRRCLASHEVKSNPDPVIVFDR